MKKRFNNNVSLIEGWGKDKSVYTRPLLTFDAERETIAPYIHLLMPNISFTCPIPQLKIA